MGIKAVIEISCMPPINYWKFSMSTLQIWVRKSGVLQNLFILCEHGTNAIFRGAKIKLANNRHAVNRYFFQVCWTSDGLSLYSSQAACEKAHPIQHREWLAKIRKVTCNVAGWRQSSVPLGQTYATSSQSCPETTMVNKYTSLSKNSEEPFEFSRTEVKESK